MTKEEVRELFKDEERAKIITDGLEMEAWLIVKKGLESGNRTEVIQNTMRFLESEIVSLTTNKERIRVFFDHWYISICKLIDEIEIEEKGRRIP
jgi:hypothetical protein